MERDNIDETLYREARKRVKQKKGFFGHLSVYMVIATFFFFLNMATDPFDLWWYIPLIPWGVGLSLHYVSVFGIPFTKGVLTKEWEERETERELRRLDEQYRMTQDETYQQEESPLELRQVEKRKNYRDSDLV